jgi:transposase
VKTDRRDAERLVRLLMIGGRLVPSENSSGEKRRRGANTKSGSRHARRLLVEAARHYRRMPRKGRELRRLQEGQPQGVCAI